ncbi:unnamed protein product, partial [Musa acuminata subsp. burmannicoides]
GGSPIRCCRLRAGIEEGYDVICLIHGTCCYEEDRTGLSPLTVHGFFSSLDPSGRHQSNDDIRERRRRAKEEEQEGERMRDQKVDDPDRERDANTATCITSSSPTAGVRRSCMAWHGKRAWFEVTETLLVLLACGHEADAHHPFAP